jgi:hypothetical protein
MEKLVLRGIMYGADKIPDSWFEKVPGGFYKGQQDKQAKPNDKDDKRRDKREKSRRRRHSDEYEERRPRYEESYDSDRPAYAPERRRRDADRSSYDGGDNNDSVDEERQRRRARRSTINDADRYGYNDGFSRRDSTRRSYAPNDRLYESSPHESQGSSQYADPYFDHAAKRNSVAAVAAGAGTTAAMAQRHVSSAHPMVPATFPVQTPITTSYVPYSNIYGVTETQMPNGRQSFSVSSVQANSMNQVTPVVSPPNTYGYPPANPSYDSRRVSGSYQPPSDRQQGSHSPSFDSAGSQPRRARSERRPNRDKERFQGKLMSSLSTMSVRGRLRLHSELLLVARLLTPLQPVKGP